MKRSLYILLFIPLFGIGQDFLIDGTDFLVDGSGNYIELPIDSYSAEYQAVYDAMTTPPISNVADAQNTMVESLVADGIWDKLDVFYLFAQETNGGSEALINWINPSTFDATLVNSPSFVSLEGFTGNGTSSYILTNYNPNTDKINLAQNSTGFGFYSRTELDHAGVDMGAYSGYYAYIQLRSSNAVRCRINATGGGTDANTSSLGMMVGNRVLSTQQDFWRNKTRYANITQASSGLPNTDFCVSALGGASVGYFATRQYSMAFIGAGLTQTNIEDLTDAFEIYMDSNGKGVIP